MRRRNLILIMMMGMMIRNSSVDWKNMTLTLMIMRMMIRTIKIKMKINV